jgi:hypothetical protein
LISTDREISDLDWSRLSRPPSLIFNYAQYPVDIENTSEFSNVFRVFPNFTANISTDFINVRCRECRMIGQDGLQFIRFESVD